MPKVYNQRMSVLAGLFLILYGATTVYLGYIEIKGPHLLTHFAAFVTAILGIFLLGAGLAHFRAPHKSFLISVPLLIYFHTQMYFNALFYFARPMWPQQISLLGISLCIVILSYFGYKSRSERIPV